MKTEEAVARLAALAQETRLELFRKLVRRGSLGLAAGALAEALAVPAPTLSFHLAALERVGITARREGRSIVYSASFAAMEETVGFLLQNCCADGACAPPAALVAPPRAKKAMKKR